MRAPLIASPVWLSVRSSARRKQPPWPQRRGNGPHYDPGLVGLLLQI